MKEKILFIFILFSTVFHAKAQYPLINNNRPRIYADSARIAWLKSNITIPGDCQSTFNNMVYAYNNWWINDPQLYVVGSDSTQWYWDWSSSYSAQQTFLSIFIYKLTNDPLELKRCRFIAQQAITRVATADFPSMEWYEKENLLRKLSDAGDLLLDWCYDDFPVSLRDQLAQSLYIMNREFMDTYILSGAGTSYVSSHNTWNTIYCNQNALTLYDGSGLTTFQKDTVVQWYQAVYDKLINGFIPCWTYYRDDDGGWNWGAAYAMWSLTDQFQLFENMRVGTNKNFYTDLPWVLNSINQYVYFNQPDNRTIHSGDGETGLKGDRVTYLHARLFNDPRSLWMAQYWSQPDLTPNTMDKFTKLLYKDFGMPVVTKPANPLNWWSDKVGLSVSLSSWESNATMVTFFNSPSKRAAHEHRDNNSFTIFKKKPLLIDAGYYDTYGGIHYRNYYQRTIAHNSICVYDSTDSYYCFGVPASNDGGQIESNALQNYNDIFLPQNQRGHWIQYASGTNYTYNVADAQLSYDPVKLDFFRRRLLYLNPNRVIVLDHIHLKNRETNQRDIKWIGHFANEPIISGNIIYYFVPGHIETYNGKDCTISNGTGNLAIRTLLPLNTTTTLIGGIGYEYWVDGTNYTPLVTPDSNYYTPGSWRIEVRPTTITTDTIIYLHTIAIGDSSNIAVAGGIALQNNYSVGADWRDTLYFFSADADKGNEYHIFDHVAGGRIVGLFAADMMPGTYYIIVDGNIVKIANTDIHGILQSSATLSFGYHTLEIVPFYTSGSESIAENPMYVYPNPCRTELSVVSKTGSTLSEIEIFNSSGELKLRSKDGKKLNISGLSAGVYLVKAIHGNRYYSTMFVKE